MPNFPASSPATQRASGNASARESSKSSWSQAVGPVPVEALPKNFAHDLNNFIAIINGYSEICLAHAGQDDEKLQKYLREIHDAAQQAADLTRQLLLLSRPKKSPPAAGFPLGSESVLIVEDDPALNELLNTVLNQHGYRPTLARDGQEATKIFFASPDAFEVVLLDLQLPGMSGLAVLQQIKQVRPAQKVITVSGCVDVEINSALKRLGVYKHLLKPYHLGELGRTLREIVAKAA